MRIEELAGLSATLSELLEQVGSVKEFAARLESQRCVQSVVCSDYLVKTEPPKMEVAVTFEMAGGSAVTKVIDLDLHHNGAIGLAGIHDP